MVDEVIAEVGRTEQRHRSLPARTMAYFAIGMALHADGSYEDVLALMTDGLAWAERGGAGEAADEVGDLPGRDRLGSEPVKALFRRVARPLAAPETPGSLAGGAAAGGDRRDLFRRRRHCRPTTTFFGRPGVMKGERSAFPQARVVALAECGTHAMFDAVVGAYTMSETTLAGS